MSVFAIDQPTVGTGCGNHRASSQISTERSASAAAYRGPPRSRMVGSDFYISEIPAGKAVERGWAWCFGLRSGPVRAIASRAEFFQLTVCSPMPRRLPDEGTKAGPRTSISDHGSSFSLTRMICPCRGLAIGHVRKVYLDRGDACIDSRKGDQLRSKGHSVFNRRPGPYLRTRGADSMIELSQN